MMSRQFFWKQMDKALTDIEAWPVMSMDPAYECGRCNVICRNSHIDLKTENADDLWAYCAMKRGPSWRPRGEEARIYASGCLFVEVWLYCWGCASGESGRPLRAGEGGTWWPLSQGLRGCLLGWYSSQDQADGCRRSFSPPSSQDQADGS